MMKRLMIAIGLVAATFTLQTPAQAGGHFSFSFGKSHGFHKSYHGERKAHKGFHGHHGKKFVKKHRGPFVSKSGLKSHKPLFFDKNAHYKKPYQSDAAFSKRKLRAVLNKKGIYNVSFLNRHKGVVRLIGHSKDGYVAKYRVSAYTGQILQSKIVRYL